MCDKLSPEDRDAQTDEINVLECIYAPNFTVVSLEDRTFEITVCSENEKFSHFITLRFTMPVGYPSKFPPEFSLRAPELSRSQYFKLLSALQSTADACIGSPAIHSLIEVVQTFTCSIHATDGKYSDSKSFEPAVINLTTPEVSTVPSVRAHLGALANVCLPSSVEPPVIFHGEIITDRKSVFQAHCCRVKSLAEVSAFIGKILEDKKVAIATHNITAWYLRTKLKQSSPTETLVADFDDDGETHAGGRLLHLITLACVEGVAVMVSRWYGGIQLGPDRFRHINNAASALLVEHGLMKCRNPEKSKHKGKKK